MIIWILAVVLLVSFAFIGLQKGAVRMVVSLIGLGLALFLSMPLSPLVANLLPHVKVTNPVLLKLLPPAIAFLLLNIIFIAISFGVHFKIEMFYKYKTDDKRFRSWKRLNQHLGAPLGILAGAIYTALIALLIYIGGYLTVQTSVAGQTPTAIRYLNQARTELESTGLVKTVAALDPMPEKYYQAADVAGLLYHNPLLSRRLSLYPPFLTLREVNEFQEMAKDPEFQTMIQSQSNVWTILNHALTLNVINNQDIMGQLMALNLPDLEAFLRSGKSQEYDPVKILGIWKIDAPSVLMRARRRNPTMKPSELIGLKKLTNNFAWMTLVVTPDQQVFWKMQLPTEIKRMMNAIQKAREDAEAQKQPRANEWGGPPEFSPQQQQPEVDDHAEGMKAWIEEVNAGLLAGDNVLLQEGNWEDLNNLYVFEFLSPFETSGSSSEKLTAKIDGDRLVMTMRGGTNTDLALLELYKQAGIEINPNVMAGLEMVLAKRQP